MKGCSVLFFLTNSQQRNAPIVGQEDARVGINIRPRIFGPTSFQKNVGRDLVDLTDHLEERVIRKVLEREFALGGVTRVLHVIRDQRKK